MTTPTDDQLISIIDDLTPPEQRLGTPWRLLVVDDNQSVLDLSDMVLAGMVVDRRPVTLFYAQSAARAQEVLDEWGHQTFALALVDLVMEDDTAGMRLVEHVRGTLGNGLMRMILRTGLSRMMPTAEAMRRLDIDGCHLKTDLRSQVLIDLVVASLCRWQERTAQV